MHGIRIMADQVVGKGAQSLVFDAIDTDGTSSDKKSEPVLVAKIESLYDSCTQTHERLRKCFENEVRVQERAFHMGLAPRVHRSFICSQREIEGLFVPHPPAVIDEVWFVPERNETYGVILMEKLAPNYLSVARWEEIVTPKTAHHYTAKILQALASLHNGGIFHGDLNPSNVFLDPTTGKVQLIDFGQSQIYERPAMVSQAMVHCDVYLLFHDLPCEMELPFASLDEFEAVYDQLMMHQEVH